MFFRVFVVVLAGVAFVECQAPDYDCRRDGTPCEGVCGTLGADAGRCICAAGRTGYDCSILGTTQQPGTCNNPVCSAASTNFFCYRPQGAVNDVCGCRAGFTGPQCSLERVRTTCGTTSMEVFVDPIPGPAFSGKIFVNGTSCTLSRTAGSNVFYRNISLTSCGISPVVDQNRDTLYTVMVVVQYNSLYQTTIDEEHNVTCKHTTSGTVTGSVSVTRGGTRPGVSVEDETVITHLEIIRVSNQQRLTIADVAVMGEPLELRIILDSTEYPTHYTGRCAVYDTSVTSVGRAEKILVSDGCIVDPGALDVVRPPMARVGRVITLPINTFKFDTSDALFFECDVLVCTNANIASCSMRTNCVGQNGLDGFGRRKRQADNTSAMKNVSAGIRVRSGTSTDIFTDPCPVATVTKYIPEPCLQSGPFVAITVVFGILLLVALVTSVVLCVRFGRRDHRDVKKIDPPVYINPTLSTA